MKNIVLKKMFMRRKQLRNLSLAGFLLGFALVPFRSPALDPNQSVFQYNCQSWSRHNGLPANNVYAIAQTKDGYLWLGTSIGLLRFDGVDFTLIGAPPVSELRNTRIACLAPAQDGGLWFGLEHSSYGLYKAGGEWFVGKNPHGDLNWDVRSLLEDPHGTLWIGGEYCSQIASGATNLHLLFADQSQAPLVNAVFQDSQGRTWLGTSGQGLYYWQAGRLNKLPDPVIGSRVVNALAEDRLGQLWVGTHTGLFCYGSNLQQRVRGRFIGSEITCLFVDRHGILWIGTSGDGLIRYKNGSFTSLRKTDGLASDFILALAEDQEGSLWIGTGDGMSQLTDVKFPTYSSADGIPGDNAVHSVSASPRGGLWVSTSIGTLYFDHGVTRMDATNSGLAIPFVKRTLEAKNGDMFVISGLNQIEVLSEDRVVARHATTNMPVALVEDSKGVVASVGGELFRVSRDGLVPYEFTNGRKPELWWVINLAPGRDDSIWVACINGICRVKDGTFKQWTQSDGLADVRWVCEEPDGTVWVGLATGIARLQNGRIRHLRRQDGLLDPNISAIVPDERDNLWVYTLRGIFRLSKKNVDDFFCGRIDHVECIAFEGPEGYGQENSACRTLDGRIWFPGSKGVIAVDPTNIPVNWVAPPVHVHRVRASGTELDRFKPLVLKPGQQDIEFSYTAISFISPEKMRFRYKLEGLDRNWIEAGERRLAYYANLKPGRYTFHVIACNADGVWNEAGATVPVELLPHFHQTVWFRLLCGVAAVGVVFGGYGWRLRHLTRKQQALLEAQALLERRVVERTAELGESNILLKSEIEERKRMEMEVERIHRELLIASRQAGQAEVASSVLHNVGNVLNSVNVSTSLIRDHLGRLSMSDLEQAAQMIREHADDLGRFLTTDEKGRHFPRYLSEVSQYLSHEQDYLLKEINGLAQNVEHINEIVAMQQNYASVSGVHEKIAASEVVENGITMNAGAFSRHGIKVIRDYEPVEFLTVDKHKLLQILVNILRNAKYACDESGLTEKAVTVRIKGVGGERVRIEIADNGVGIPPENLTRIFSHGFTTREHGHGFGLHSAALAAKDMGGSLAVHSEGAGKGAMFILELPLNPPDRAEKKSPQPGSR